MNEMVCVGLLDIRGKEQQRRVYSENGISPTLTAKCGGNHEVKVAIGAIRGRNPENPSDRTAGIETKQRLEIGGEISNTLTTVEKDNVVVEYEIIDPQGRKNKTCKPSILAPTLRAQIHGNPPLVVEKRIRVRKLTPKEYYRLMVFTDEQFERAEKVISKTQLYKTAGNSIIVDVLSAIFKEML